MTPTLTLVSVFASLLGLSEPAGQAIGFYSNGRLHAASSLAMDGPGYMHFNVERNRHYGTAGLITLLESAAAEIREKRPEGERLQIGDIAAEHGGVVSGHVSHQNGLDADLIYFRLDHLEAWASGDHFVTPKGTLSDNFDTERNFELIHILVASGRVNRIFMDPVIKKGFCSYAAAHGGINSAADTLRRMSPYPNHQDHMHVRLTCPPTSPQCQAQTPEVPAGDGCKNLSYDPAEIDGE
jgi:penicillin-insensitive murein endopeptidase